MRSTHQDEAADGRDTGERTRGKQRSAQTTTEPRDVRRANLGCAGHLPLATRRLADNARGAFRAVTGLVLAVFLGTMTAPSAIRFE